MKYTTSFRYLVLKKILPPLNRSVTSFSKETGVAVVTINNWLANPIESMFATVRLRHRSTKGNGSSKATLTMVFKLCKKTEKNWRRLKGFEKLRLVQQDVIFVDGLLAA